MLFYTDDQKKKCPNCGYLIVPPFPSECPKCNKKFSEGIKSQKNSDKYNKKITPIKSESSTTIFSRDLKKKKKVSRNSPTFKTYDPSASEEPKQKISDFAKIIKIQANPDMVLSDQIEQVETPKSVGKIAISKSSASDTNKRIKIKVKKRDKIDLSQPKIELGKNNEYIKFMGIITKDRLEIYHSNEKYKYFLELGSNLDFIATSILSGELDRMMLSPPDGGLEEICFFLSENDLLYIIYGNFPDKKATWLLNQMKTNLNGLLKSKDISMLNKAELYNLTQNFQPRVKFMLEEYIKLQDVFTSRKLKSLDKDLRIDYFGLSYLSIGVISKLITDELTIQGLPPMNPDDKTPDFSQSEMIEALITAKVEAMAANTVANTQMMPHWISVKLGFQHYRFILFAKLREYYISLLAEGNIELKEKILIKIKTWLDTVTKKPFTGVLEEFKKVQEGIVEFLKKRHQQLSIHSEEF